MSRRGLRERPAANRSPARIASSNHERRVRPSARRKSGVSRPTAGANVLNAAIHRPELCSQAASRCASTPVWRQEKRPSPASRNGSVKYSSDAPSFSTASSSSSAVTPRSPVSIAETVCRSLKPNRRATLSWVSFRCSRSALIRAPMSGGPTDDLPELIANSLMQELYATAMMPVARSVIRRAHGTRSAREDEPSLRDAWRLQKLLGQDLAGSRPRRRRAGRGHRHAAGFRAGRAAALRPRPLGDFPAPTYDQVITSPGRLRLSSSGTGRYHGYRLEDEDDMRSLVLKEWKKRGQPDD